MADENFSGSVKVGSHLLIGERPSSVRIESDLLGNLLVNKTAVGGNPQLSAKIATGRALQARVQRDQILTFDRYVDQTNGLDTNTGASPDLAWKTLAKVNTSATASQKIGLRRGQVWREIFTVPADTMTFGAYGELMSPAPKIKASKDYTAATWTLVSGSTWNATITAPTTPNGAAFWKEDNVLFHVASAGAVTIGTYNITSTTMTIWLPDSSNPNGQQIEVTDLAGTGWLDQKVGTIVQDITLKHHASYSIIRQPSAGSAGGSYRRLEVGPALGPDAFNWSNTVGFTIEDCNVHQIWDGAAYPSGHGNGIHMVGPFYDGNVQYNRVSQCYVGIYGSSDTHKCLNIHHNRVLRSRVNGIDIENGTAGWVPNVFNNVVWHSPDPVGAAGHGIVSQIAAVGPKWRNNIVFSDYTGSVGDVQLYALSPAISSLPGTDVDYNLGFLMPGCTANYAQINGTYYATLALWQGALAAASVAGAEAHGVSGDPLFADYTNEDFTLNPGSPAINAGQVLGYPGETYTGTSVDMGIYEIS